jgi:hypothetical protein
MKRRTFIQLSLAGLASGLPAHIAEARTTQPPVLFEPVRQYRGPQDWGFVTIGLGIRGAQLAKELDFALHPEQEALIYADRRTNPTFYQGCFGCSIADALDEIVSGVLLFSLEEPATWQAAVAWANYLLERDVYLKAAVVCTRDATETALLHPLTEFLRGLLDVVVVQPDSNLSTTPKGFHPAIQPARTFLTEPSLIGFDIADLRPIFHDGALALSTSSPALPIGAGGDPGNGVDTCFEQLGGRRISGVVVRWTDGLHLSLNDFDAIRQRLNQRLSGDVVTGVMTGIDLDLEEGDPGMLHAIWTLSA